MPKKYKKKTETAKADKEFSIFIRRRDTNDGWGNCFTCGENIEFQSGRDNCGHFISRRYKSLRWDERNAHLQCVKCNFTGEIDAYFVEMENRYGRELIDELMAKKNEKGPSASEIHDIYLKYKALNNE